MRFAAVLFVAVACSTAFASQPGQPLDCSDFTFNLPGFACRAASEFVFTSKGTTLAIENAGRQLWADGAGGGSVDIVMSDDGGVQSIAFASFRVGSPGTNDFIEPGSGCRGGGCPPAGVLWFDAVNGRVLVPVTSFCLNDAGGTCPSYAPVAWVLEISGFAKMFDIFQTYAPSGAGLTLRVPAMPDGLRSADHFDTYWGPLSHPIDFTQAHPLQCDYPTPAPHVGDYLTVNDTLPTPAPGAGYYYVTAATYQGQTRYGRKTTAGHPSGRDPALLPACQLP